MKYIGPLNIISQSFSLILALLVSATNGTLAIDSMTISQHFMYIFLQFPYGVAVAGNIYSGHFLGANKPGEAINATKVFFTLIS